MVFLILISCYCHPSGIAYIIGLCANRLLKTCIEYLPNSKELPISRIDNGIDTDKKSFQFPLQAKTPGLFQVLREVLKRKFINIQAGKLP